MDVEDMRSTTPNWLCSSEKGPIGFVRPKEITAPGACGESSVPRVDLEFSLATIREILDHLPKLSALVVGDICLDRWCTYDPAEAEPSRETGIPRIGVLATTVTAGAGGTVANNLAALGVGRVAVLGA